MYRQISKPDKTPKWHYGGGGGGGGNIPLPPPPPPGYDRDLYSSLKMYQNILNINITELPNTLSVIE